MENGESRKFKGHTSTSTASAPLCVSGQLKITLSIIVSLGPQIIGITTQLIGLNRYIP